MCYAWIKPHKLYFCNKISRITIFLFIQNLLPAVISRLYTYTSSFKNTRHSDACGNPGWMHHQDKCQCEFEELHLFCMCFPWIKPHMLYFCNKISRMTLFSPVPHSQKSYARTLTSRSLNKITHLAFCNLQQNMQYSQTFQFLLFTRHHDHLEFCFSAFKIFSFVHL